MLDLPNAKLATSVLHFLSPIRRAAIACLQVHQAIAAPSRFRDPSQPNPHSLGIEFISLFRGYFGKSNIEFSSPAASNPHIAEFPPALAVTTLHYRGLLQRFVRFQNSFSPIQGGLQFQKTQTNDHFDFGSALFRPQPTLANSIGLLTGSSFH